MATVGNLKPFDPTVDDIDIWIRAFKSFLLANDMDPAPPADMKDADAVKKYSRCRAVLLSSLGLSAVATLSSLLSPVLPEDKDLEGLLKALTAHYKPPPKAPAERYRFTSRKQQQGESVSQYLAELRRLASTCKFETELENRLRDQFIFGLKNEAAQNQIFTKPDNISLDDVVTLAVAQELSEQSLSVVRGGSSHHSQDNAEVNKVNKNTASKHKYQQHGKKRNGQQQNQHYNSQSKCPNCGSSSHKRKECPHTNVECYNCHKLGHFASMCRGIVKVISQNSSSPSQAPTQWISCQRPYITSHQIQNQKKKFGSLLRLMASNMSWSMTPDVRMRC